MDFDRYLTLCECLSGGDSGAVLNGRSPAELDEIWRIAEAENVLATLYVSLADRVDGVDETWLARLRRRYQHNTVRNLQIRRQTIDLAKILNDAAIVPMVLKGGLALFGEIYDDPGAREMADVDLLVREGDFRRSVSLMKKNDFRAQMPGQSWTFQANPMARPHDLAAVEIHRYVGEQRCFLPVDEVWRRGTEIDVEGARIALPHPTHRIAHNIFHSEVQDRGYALRLLRVRQLYDLARMMSQTRGADWAEVIDRFKEHRLEGVLRGRVSMSALLLDAPFPEELGEIDDRQLKRVINRLKSPALASVLGLWGGLSAPFKAHHIDLTYDCGISPGVLFWYRTRHFFTLLGRHGFGAVAKVGVARRMYE